MVAISDPSPLIAKAAEIEGRLDGLTQKGFLFEFGGKAVNYLKDEEVDSAWSLLSPLANYSMRQETTNMFKQISQWTRETQGYTRVKWGWTSSQYQQFKKGNDKLLLLFRASSVSPNSIAPVFAQQASEFSVLVKEEVPPRWKKALAYLPDLLKLSIAILRG